MRISDWSSDVCSSDLIASGACDLGIVGRNVLLEQAAAAPGQYREWRALGFGGCRLDIAVPEDWAWEGPAQLASLRIATSYPALLGGWLREQGIDAEIVALSGSVETAPRPGPADAVCDLVPPGARTGRGSGREGVCQT